MVDCPVLFQGNTLRENFWLAPLIESLLQAQITKGTQSVLISDYYVEIITSVRGRAQCSDPAAWRPLIGPLPVISRADWPEGVSRAAAWGRLPPVPHPFISKVKKKLLENIRPKNIFNREGGWTRPRPAPGWGGHIRDCTGRQTKYN